MAENQEPNLNLNVEINRLVHEPVRLKILVTLSLVESADFVFLDQPAEIDHGQSFSPYQQTSGGRIYPGGQGFCGEPSPRTMISLTTTARQTFEKYKEEMLQILQ
ncbi:MAG: hypothetical protein MUP11_05810 [Anaerolineales bacterium]|nr:hypothetical protein [Anaerolineales bacterium]